MIIKRLRTDNNWSQEQLAAFTGLSLRTIQRVEAGDSASLETLKSLASVFEIELSMLTEELVVIDKETEAWKQAPLWLSLGVWGIRTRKTAMKFEILCVVVAFVALAVSFIEPTLAILNVAWAAAYWYSVSIRWIDNAGLWRRLKQPASNIDTQ